MEKLRDFLLDFFKLGSVVLALPLASMSYNIYVMKRLMTDEVISPLTLPVHYTFWLIGLTLALRHLAKK